MIQYIAIMPIFATIVAAHYQVGYFTKMGLVFLPLLSVYDHAALAIELVPASFIAALFLLLLKAIPEMERSMEAVGEEGTGRKRSKRVILAAIAFVMLSAIISTAVEPVLALQLSGIFILYVGWQVVIYLSETVANHDRSVANAMQNVSLALAVVFTGYSIMGFGAYHATRSLLEAGETQLTLCDKKNKCTKYEVVAVFSSGSLIKDGERLTFIDNAKTRRVSTDYPDSNHLVTNILIF